MSSTPPWEAVIEQLATAKKRLYMFDDDADGLMAFLLLNQQYPAHVYRCLLGGPMDEEQFVATQQEADHDLAIILDRPHMSQQTINTLQPVIWIDHHPPVRRQNVTYVNPRKYDSNQPTAAVVSQLLPQLTIEQKLMIVLGSVWDYYIPKCFAEVREHYPQLIDTNSTNLDTLHFNTRLGLLIRYISFLLSGDAKTVQNNIEHILSLNHITEIETDSQLQTAYQPLEDRYERLLAQAQEEAIALSDQCIVFTYSARDSYTSYLANQLRHIFQTTVIVAKESTQTDRCTMSIRATNDVSLHNILPQALHGLSGNYGGHEQACGGYVARDDFETFLNRMREQI